MKTGDKVVCVDDAGWLLSPEHPHLTPKKGEVYMVMGVEYFGAVFAVSLVGGNEEDFYRASRFRLVSEVGHPPIALQQPTPHPAPTP
jgi:hypothetical protein